MSFIVLFLEGISDHVGFRVRVLVLLGANTHMHARTPACRADSLRSFDLQIDFAFRLRHGCRQDEHPDAMGRRLGL